MKHLKLFFALFAMLALGVGNASAETVTLDNLGAGISSTSNTTVSTTTVNGYTLNYLQGKKQGNSILLAKGSNGGSSFISNKTPIPGAIKSVTVYINSGASGSATYHCAFSITECTSRYVTGSTAVKIAGGSSNKYTCSVENASYFCVALGANYNGQVLKLVIEYTPGSSDSSEPTISATPTTIDFGTVYQGSSVANQTVTVNFENLTGNVTYSGLSTPFTATGTVSNDGDQITIAADASTIGDYTQTLTITSAADSKTAEVTVKMNVVEKPAPTGTFTLHTGDLIEGDYVIYYSGKAMKAVVSSNRLGYEEVTPSGNEIVDPLAETIWHIAPIGSNWTIYNDNKGYAAGTGTKSQAQLVANLTGDNANKAAWTVTGTSTYEFTNVWNTSQSVNAALRNNTTYGFACYATSTGGALSLYRKAGEKYDVTVNSTTNGTVTADPTSAEAGTTITLTVTPKTGYVLDALTVTDASSNTVTVTNNNEFTMPASDVTVTATFKENEKPAATLTLIKNDETEDLTGYKQGEKVELPSITSNCVKEFVGWSADDKRATEPEYKAGDEYTLESTTQTLYAVYATVGAGETLTITPSAVSGSEDPYTFTINATGYSLTAKKNSGSTAPTYTSNEVRVYAKGTVTLTAPKAMGTIVFNISTNGKKRLAPITASVGTIATQASGDATVTWTGDATEVTFTVGDIAEFGSENTKAGQLCFGTITVTTAGSYSDYSTTCSAALANPTFSLTEGKYTEAKSVEITAAEGTVYYTTDGTPPTASSTQYTGAIALNDCGEYTIKAIAISSDSQSDVVSATYMIKLPLTNSQAAPYTEAEAIAVYDGGCYDNQDVYVKGTVKTATFNSTYGNYTITLTNGFQFYRFLQAAETKFTEDIIVPGDVLVACGKLGDYNGNCQLAAGCYLVERIPYEGEKTDISNTEATAYTVDQAFALIADVSSDLTKEVYVKGLVAVAPTSNPTADGQMTYSISDNGENTGNVLKVYLGLNLNGEKFTSKNDVQQGDYVVVKGKLLDYNSTYELNKGNQLVQHLKAATITIADITMEVGETKTIAATITPAAAETAVVYTIKENTDNAISLSGNTITADAVGTATITATIETAAGYMGKTVDFTVTVTPESTSDEVVILAELDGKWYAMKGAVPTGKSNQLDAIEVTYFNGTLYNVPDEVKASITWTRSVVDGKATFVNNGKYLKGGTSTDLNLAGTVDNNCKWMWNDENGYYTTNTSGTIRTFLYRENYNFKNYGASQAGKEDANGNYSELPVVTAPVYKTGDVTYTRATTAGKFGTICLPFGSTNYTGAEFFEFVGSETGKVYIGSVDELVAGVPYIFLASAAKVVVTSDGTTAATPGNSNGLYGTFTNDTEVAIGNYILKDNALCLAEDICWVNAYRAYIVMSEVPTDPVQQMPGRRYIGMSVQGENEATGFENITAPEGKTVKAIVNGQLIIIRDGEMYNAQGVRL